MVGKAREFAIRKHSGQVDKAGVEYWKHPEFVASQLEDEKLKCVGWLHDVLEDTETTEEELRKEFGNEIADLVDILTHKDGEGYYEYVDRVAKNSEAKKVKLADIKHNMDLSRLPEVTEKDIERIKKYKKALLLLNGGAE